jgi:manganese-dependent inorganic pyrophosphatase
VEKPVIFYGGTTIETMEQEKERVFVAGHKNPDMDCTCAAYCYAALKQTTDPTREYVPIRSGPLSEQIRSVFEQASCEIPGHYDTIAPSVGLVARKSPSLIRMDDPVLEVFNAVKVKTISSIPVFDENDVFQGMVGINEITSWVVEQNQGLRPFYTFLIRNFDHVLPGTIAHQGQ